MFKSWGNFKWDLFRLMIWRIVWSCDSILFFFLQIIIFNSLEICYQIFWDNFEVLGRYLWSLSFICLDPSETLQILLAFITFVDVWHLGIRLFEHGFRFFDYMSDYFLLNTMAFVYVVVRILDWYWAEYFAGDTMFLIWWMWTTSIDYFVLGCYELWLDLFTCLINILNISLQSFLFAFS